MIRKTPTNNPSHAEHLQSERASKTHRWKSALLLTFTIILGLLLIAQGIASPVAQRMINQKLASMPGYRGHVDKVNIALWRGGGEAEGFALYPESNDHDLPLVRIEKIAWKVATPALLSGKLEGEIIIQDAEFNVIKEQAFAGPVDAAKHVKEKVKEKKEEAAPWQDTLRKTFPIEITRCEVKNSKIRFVDRAHQPNVDVAINQLHILATGLRNRTEGDALPTKVAMEGITTGDGKLKINIEADPMSKTPRFTETMELRALSLPPINTFLLAYSGVDVSKGTFDLYSEAKAEGGGYSGYIKPFLRDLDFKTASDREKPVIEKVAKTVANAAVSLLKNKDEQTVATQAPFSGKFSDNSVDLWTTIDNLLRHAFLQALREGFSGHN